ncbi:MAG: hypothetical protein ABSD79_00740 [Dehalococcoidales bacterium]|jgi:hypothetical protein
MNIGGNWFSAGLGLIGGVVFGLIITSLIYAISHIEGWLHAAKDRLKNMLSALGKLIPQEYQKRIVRTLVLLIALILFIALTIVIKSTGFTVIGLSFLVGLIIFSSLCNERIFDVLFKFARGIFQRISSWAKNDGEEIGTMFMYLGIALLIIGGIIGIIVSSHANDAGTNLSDSMKGPSELLNFGLGFLSTGLGFLAINLGAQSDKRIMTIVGFDCDETLKELSEYTYEVNTESPSVINKEKIKISLNRVNRLVSLLSPDDRLQLDNSISKLKDAINDYHASTTEDNWRTSGYPELVSMIEILANNVKAQ